MFQSLCQWDKYDEVNMYHWEISYKQVVKVIVSVYYTALKWRAKEK